MKIKDILSVLKPDDNKMLMYAFENGLTNQYVVYREGRFIGVRISLKTLRIEQEAGLFSEGSLLMESNGHV